MWFGGNGNTHLFVCSNNCSLTKVFVQISSKAIPWKMNNMMLSKDNITNYCHTAQYRSVWQTTAAHNLQAGACSFNSSGKCVSAHTEYEWTDSQQMGAIVFGMTLKLYGSWISSFGCLILLISNISYTNSNRLLSEGLRKAKSIFSIKKCVLLVCAKWIDSFQGALFNMAFCFIGIKVMF